MKGNSFLWSVSFGVNSIEITRAICCYHRDDCLKSEKTGIKYAILSQLPKIGKILVLKSVKNKENN